MNEERANSEKEVYNKGINRNAYDSKFGYANSGIAEFEKKTKMIKEIAKKSGGVFLELGSVSWNDYIDFQNAPKALYCINISEKELEKGIKLSEKVHSNKFFEHHFQIMDANHLTFEDDSFDVVYGSGILHHLDFEQAVQEIFRVLKKDGVIVFQEPLARNPIGKIVRKRTPEARTPNEKPLDKKEFNILKRYFDLNCSFYQFLYVPAGVISRKFYNSSDNWIMKAAYKVDCLLLKLFYKTNLPFWYRRVVIYGIVKK